MTNEQLNILSEKLSKLTELEKRQRDLYLRKIATGEIQGPVLITGYPGIDKPWLKYYEEADLKDLIPQETIYDYMKSHSKGFDDLTAISYYGREISYAKMHDNISTAAKVLKSIGVKDNDRIMYLMPNIPETAYLFYGTSKIGAVADYIDPRPESLDPTVSAKKVLSLIEKEKSKFIVALDQCYLAMIKPIEKQLKEMGIDKIVIVSASDSMNLKATMNYIKQGKMIDGKEKFNAKMKRNKQIGKIYEQAKQSSILEILEYKDLVKNVKYEQELIVPYEKDKMVAITHTSGTSGTPKPVPITHDNLNTYAHESYHIKTPLDPGDRVLHILPYFAAYGIANIVHPGLSHGTNLIQIPEIETQNFGKVVSMNKTAISVGIPTWYIAMLNDPYLKDKSLAFLKFMSFGGMNMSAEEEKAVNEFLHAHGAKINLSKGHGMSETCGCSSIATADVNELRTLGIPLPYTSYSFVDPITKEPLQFSADKEEIEGEMIISTKAATSGELDGVHYIKHANYFGEDYILTGDIARMNKDGIMRFDSRLDRGFPRCDGFNVKPGIIEENIENDELVKYCVISPYFDEQRLGNMIKATIVLKDGTELNEQEKVSLVERIIQERFVDNHALSARQIPTKFIFIKELPKKLSDKIDYEKIDNYGFDGSEISVELDESNVSLNGIEVKGKTYKRILTKKS